MKKKKSVHEQVFGYRDHSLFNALDFYGINGMKQQHKGKTNEAQRMNQLQWNEDTLLNSELLALDSLFFTVNIVIVKAYRYGHRKDAKSKQRLLIPTYEWSKFGIVNLPQTKRIKKKKDLEKEKEKEKKRVSADDADKIENVDDVKRMQKDIQQFRKQQNENTETLKIILQTLQNIQTTTNSISDRLSAFEKQRSSADD